MGARACFGVLVAAALTVALVAAAPAVALVRNAEVGVQTVYRPDAFEPDGGIASAKTLPEASVHGFHSASDEDWSVVTADATGQPFVLETQYIDGPRLDTEIAVYGGGPGAPTLLASNDDAATWPKTSASELLFVAPAPGTYHIVVRPADPGDVGTYVLHEVKGIGRRIAGADRYATAAELSYLAYPGVHLPATYDGPAGPDSVVVANGASFADAMTGGVLAAMQGAPLLLTRSDRLHDTTAAEIRRLTISKQLARGYPLKVYVIGGTGAVSATVAGQLEALEPVTDVVRLGGATRYATAAAIAAEEAVASGVSATAFVVSGQSWADALAVAPVAQAAGSPVLLVSASAVPTETSAAIRSLGITHVVIVGGTGVVAPAVEAALGAVPGVTLVERIAGDDRYLTAAAVAEHGVNAYGMDPGRLILASGQGFADALPAATIARFMDAPLLLTRGGALSAPVSAYARTHRLTGGPSYVLGGTGVISDGTFGSFKALWSEAGR